MPHGVVIVVVIEREIQYIGPQGVETAEVSGESARGFAISVGMNAVNFSSIACGKNQRLLKDALSAKLFPGLARLINGKRNLLPHLHGCCAKIQADEDNFHAVSRALLKIPVALRKEQIHHRKIQDYEHKIKHAQS